MVFIKTACGLPQDRAMDDWLQAIRLFVQSGSQTPTCQDLLWIYSLKRQSNKTEIEMLIWRSKEIHVKTKQNACCRVRAWRQTPNLLFSYYVPVIYVPASLDLVGYCIWYICLYTSYPCHKLSVDKLQLLYLICLLFLLQWHENAFWLWPWLFQAKGCLFHETSFSFQFEFVDELCRECSFMQ